MPISVPEAVSDVPEAVALAQTVMSLVNALPAADKRKPSDFLVMAAGILQAAGPLADKLVLQAKD